MLIEMGGMRWPALVLVAALVVALAAAGCSSRKSQADADEAAEEEVAAEKTSATGGDDADTDADGTGEDEEDPVPVEVTAIERGPIEEVLRSSTTLEAERSVAVFSKTRGIVEELLVEEGHVVDEGEVLLRLEDDEQRNAVARARAELRNARREFERKKRLFEQELIAEQDYNDATFEIERLEIALDDAQLQLDYTEVRAPIGGTITQRMVNAGQLVNANERLFEMIDFESIVARVYIPEQSMADVERGQLARIRAEASGVPERTGRVLRIAPTVDARSGTVKVTVEVGRQPGLRPGMFVDVDIVTDTRDDAVLVPKRALVYDGDQSYVYRVKDDKRVERVLVDAELSDESHVLPRAGLDVGDEVVVAGQAGLKNGALVEIPGAAAASAVEDPAASERADDTVQEASL